jgi:hypothetical protein
MLPGDAALAALGIAGSPVKSFEEAARGACEPSLAAQVQAHVENGLPLSDAAFELISGDPMMLVHIGMWAGRLRARAWIKTPKDHPQWRLPVKRAEALAERIAARLIRNLDHWQTEAVRLSDELRRLKEERHVDYW